MARIQKVHAREVLDSRGNPTVEVEVHCNDGSFGRAIVPSGASTGQREACELRDGDPARYDGRGVLKAVANVNRVLGPSLVALDVEVENQAAIDTHIVCEDDSEQKTKLGANALLGISLAVAHAGAAAKRVPLYRHIETLFRDQDAINYPVELALGVPAPPSPPFVPRMPLPMTNMISGGLHAGGNLDFQDFLILPVGAKRYSEGLEWIVRVYRRLGELLTNAGYEGRLVGDEGGYGPRLKSNAEAVEFVVRAVEAAKLRPGEDVAIALDVAASHFFDGESYRLSATGGARLSSGEMIDELESLLNRFPIVSIEDGLAENDWGGWQDLTRRLGKRVRLVGDDLFVTNTMWLENGIYDGMANAVLIKVNQIGTLSETLRTMYVARRAGYLRVVSARSGETEDTTIADLAVGTAAEQIKIGCITRSERLAKYNRLLRIEEELEG